MPDFLFDGPVSARATILLAHGAGAGWDMPFLSQMAEALGGQGFRVARFEFDYMAARRVGGSKRPPPRMPVLEQEYRAAVEALACEGPLILAGKSMGGRVASLIAGELWLAGQIAGLVCLGYPFHPQKKPESLRVAHLADLRVPTLICQGTRDPFGTQDEVVGYALSPSIRLHWLEDGDHDFTPRKRVIAASQADHIAGAARAVGEWWQGLAT